MTIARRFAALAAMSALAMSGFAGTALANDSGVSPEKPTPSGTAPSDNFVGGPAGGGGGVGLSGEEAKKWIAAELNTSFKLAASKQQVKRGEEIVFTVSPKADLYKAVGGRFHLEVHSKVYKLGLFTKEANKDLNVTWKIPADMELGKHKVVIPESDGKLVAVFEVVGDKAGNGKLANTGAADVTAAIALLGMAGAGAVVARRRMS